MNPAEETTYREGINARFDNIDKSLATLDRKVTYTNGKVRKHEKIIWLASGVVIATLLSGNSTIVHFLLSVI